MDFRLTTPELASNCWPATPQSLVNEMFEKTRGQIEDLEGVIISATTPDPEYQGRLWIKVDVGGVPLGHFKYYSGKWIWPVEGYDLDDRRFWRGELASLPLKDGGTVGIATQFTGPFWELDEEMNGRVAVGAGGLPSGASLTAGQTGGLDTNSLTDENLPAHRHGVSLTEGSGDLAPAELGGFGVGVGASGSSDDDLQWRSNANTTRIGYTRENTNVLETTAFTNMQPYLVGYWIRRTIRQYYTG
jgi:microcystin-dependent protein